VTSTMIELGTWPKLLVTGEPVAEAQANEIILRTTAWSIACDDKKWMYLISRVLRVPLTEDYDHLQYGAVQQFQRAHQVLPLAYLNNWRIASSHFGGPWGWCDWDGTIGLNRHSLSGKYPSVDVLTSEWVAIAAAFPYLQLRAQVLPEDPDKRDGTLLAPAAEWRVAAGRVKTDLQPGEPICEPVPFDHRAAVERLLTDPYRDRGVTLDRLRAAVQQLTNA